MVGVRLVTLVCSAGSPHAVATGVLLASPLYRAIHW
jgi:hypothetical protein